MSDIKLINVETSGELAKSVRNAQHSIDCNGNVLVKECKFGQKGYNCLEICLNKNYNANSVIVEDCDFTGALANNAISIFGTVSNSTVLVKNCKFESVSNAIRLSNKMNATNVNITFKDCEFTSKETGDYEAVVLCQDYTSQTNEEVENNNLFASNKLTLRFDNCSFQGVKIEHGFDISKLVYVYRDKADTKLLKYNNENKSKYPNIIIL